MKRNVFLSFTTEDKELANLFRLQAQNRQSALVFRDYAIKEAFEFAWKTNAERIIRSCSVTICLIGKTTYQSKSVDWEVRKSAELGKCVIAVSLEPAKPIVPAAIAALKVKLLPWDIERIVGAVNGIETEDDRARGFRRATIRNVERTRTFNTR